LTKIRDLLDLLGRDALVRLADLRALQPSPYNDERRGRIARSYRGDINEFLGDLRRMDLVTLLQGEWEIQGRFYYLPSVAQRTHEELLAIAIEVMHDRPSSELREGEEQEAALEADAIDAVEPASDPEDAAQPRDPVAVLGIGVGWSRPRKVSRVLAALGMRPGERLRTPRFQAAMRELAELGIVVELDDGTPLGPGDDSPGIAARVRLRRREAGEVWPPATPSPARAPVVLVQGATAPSRPPTPVSEWELALMRLQFLTCVHDVDRRFRPDWPSAFVAAATKGLDLEPEHLRMLPLVAASVSYGTHDPVRVIAQLAPRLDVAAWSFLLSEFRRLNGTMPDLAEEIARMAERAAGLEPGSPGTPEQSGGAAEPTAAADTSPVASTEAAGRSLGKLDDIFD